MKHFREERDFSQPQAATYVRVRSKLEIGYMQEEKSGLAPSVAIVNIEVWINIHSTCSLPGVKRSKKNKESSNTGPLPANLPPSITNSPSISAQIGSSSLVYPLLFYFQGSLMAIGLGGWNM